MLEIEFKDVEFLPCDTPKDKRDREHIAGIELCRGMIKKHFGTEFDSFIYNDNGKPLVDKEGIFFNTSHSKGRVVCAISDKPVGVDIEKLTEKSSEEIENFAKRYFVENEILALELENYSSVAFYEIWTKKEAYSKMLGSALSRNFKIDTTSLPIVTYVNDGYVWSIATTK